MLQIETHLLITAYLWILNLLLKEDIYLVLTRCFLSCDA